MFFKGFLHFAEAEFNVYLFKATKETPEKSVKYVQR